MHLIFLPLVLQGCYCRGLAPCVINGPCQSQLCNLINLLYGQQLSPLAPSPTVSPSLLTAHLTFYSFPRSCSNLSIMSRFLIMYGTHIHTCINIQLNAFVVDYISNSNHQPDVYHWRLILLLLGLFPKESTYCVVISFQGNGIHPMFVMSWVWSLIRNLIKRVSYTAVRTAQSTTALKTELTATLTAVIKKMLTLVTHSVNIPTLLLDKNIHIEQVCKTGLHSKTMFFYYYY